MKIRLRELLFNQKHFDIQYIMAIALIGAMLVASMGALLMNTVSLHQQLQRNMETYADDLTAQLASEISSKMNMRSDHMVNLAETFATLSEWELTEERLIHNARHMNLEDIFVVEADGSTFAANKVHSGLGPYLAANPELYTEPQIFFTEQDEVLFSAPILWADREPSILIGVRNKAGLQEMLGDVAARSDGVCCMVDSAGKVIVSATDIKPFMELDDIFNKNAKSADQDAARRVKEDVKNGRSGVELFETIGDEQVLLGYDFLQINDWMLLTLVPTNQFSEGVEKHLMKNVGIIFIMSVMLVVIFFYLIGVYRRSLKRIQNIALTDPLTGGNNNQAFRIECERLMREYPHQSFALVYLNIRNFKRFNERYGVKVSDEILSKVYETLQGELVQGETIARDVGDHYFLFLQCEDKAAVLERLNQMMDGIVEELAERFLIGRDRIAMGAYLVQNRDADVLVMQSWAKIACDYIKENVVCNFYDEKIEAQMLWEHRLQDDFERAIKNREFKVYIQPKVCRGQKAAASGEVLVRWEHPEYGLIPPGRFIPVFERDGKICDLDFYMFEETCRLLKRWIEQGCVVPLSVNLSRAHLVSDDRAFLEHFGELKEAYGIPDDLIELELTESLMLGSNEMGLIVELIDHIREMGFLCSIDDFGSGYSSLSMLQNLNVTTVKLDRQFFMDENDKTWKVVHQMIHLAHDLDMTVVAEGIEEPEQVEKLWKYGCDMIQGYVFAKPMDVDAFKNWELDGNR